MPTPHHNDNGHCECGSLWTPYSLATPDDWADDPDDEFTPEPPTAALVDTRPGASQADRLQHAWYRFAELLLAHGVDPVDVPLLMPRWRGLRSALARELDREHDAALAADQSVCQQVWPVCPEHGDTLGWRRRQTRCRTHGCRRHWPEHWLARHCDQPAVAVVIYPATTTAESWPGGAGLDTVRQSRLCRGHLATDQGAVVVRTLDERDDPPGPDTRRQVA